jgi:hypothetical protein
MVTVADAANKLVGHPAQLRERHPVGLGDDLRRHFGRQRPAGDMLGQGLDLDGCQAVERYARLTLRTQAIEISTRLPVPNMRADLEQDWGWAGLGNLPAFQSSIRTSILVIAVRAPTFAGHDQCAREVRNPKPRVSRPV